MCATSDLMVLLKAKIKAPKTRTNSRFFPRFFSFYEGQMARQEIERLMTASTQQSSRQEKPDAAEVQYS